MITDVHAHHLPPEFVQFLTRAEIRRRRDRVLDALKGGSKRDWFVWSEQMPVGWDIWGKNPWYWAASKPWTFPGEPKDLPKPPPAARGHYCCTFGPHMPDFNLGKPEVVDWHLDNLRFWLNRGLAGFRLASRRRGRFAMK